MLSHIRGVFSVELVPTGRMAGLLSSHVVVQSQAIAHERPDTPRGGQYAEAAG